MQERVRLTKAIRKMRLRRPRKSMSIQNVTIVTFICLFLLSLVTIEKLVLNNWQSSITRETAGISGKMNQDVIEKMNSFFRVPVTANELGKKLIENKTIDFLNEKSRNSFFIGILESYEKEIYSFTYASVDGEYYGALRNNKGELELIKSNDETGGESWRCDINEETQAPLIPGCRNGIRRLKKRRGLFFRQYTEISSSMTWQCLFHVLYMMRKERLRVF